MSSVSKTLRALFFGVALVSLMVACVATLLLNEIRRPAGADSTPVEIVVESGETTSSIATKLRAAGLIRQPLLFMLLVRSQGLDGHLQAGKFSLRPTMTMSQIISALRQSEPVVETQVQVIEGWRLEEIAEQLAAADLEQVDAETFLAAARNGAAFKDRYALLASLPAGASLEGYLFPDTYRFARTATVTDVIDVMLSRFDEQYKSFEREVQVPDASVHEIVTIASLVQREAARTDEMSRIAAVFWNRIRTEAGRNETGGGKLQADPTVQYLLGKPGDWWPRLDTYTRDQLVAVPGAYNTLANNGLPPGPISNPGLDALRAAAQPDTSAQYLYFVASCPRDGSHKFATNLAEFQQLEQESVNCGQ